MPRAKGLASLDRRVGGRSANDYTIFVAYDGQRTEDDYFRGWKLVIPPSRFSLENTFVRSGGNVLEAVKAAIKVKNKAMNYAEFWCVTDVDDTTNADLDQAKSLALEQNIKLCLSRRCFEVWILLHFHFSEREICDEADAIAQVAQHCPDYGSPTRRFHSTACTNEPTARWKTRSA
jgi:hypothetical protein